MSNVSRGATGTSGGFSAGNTVAPTDGTQRASTEALLKTVIKAAWNAGGKPNLLLMGSTQKQAFSAFTGIATQYQEPKGKIATVIGAVDRYVSDFGTFSVASRYMRGREIEVIDPSLWRILWLRKWKKEELAQDRRRPQVPHHGRSHPRKPQRGRQRHRRRPDLDLMARRPRAPPIQPLIRRRMATPPSQRPTATTRSIRRPRTAAA